MVGEEEGCIFGHCAKQRRRKSLELDECRKQSVPYRIQGNPRAEKFDGNSPVDLEIEVVSHQVDFADVPTISASIIVRCYFNSIKWVFYQLPGHSSQLKWSEQENESCYRATENVNDTLFNTIPHSQVLSLYDPI